jgi:hypothetical protein
VPDLWGWPWPRLRSQIDRLQPCKEVNSDVSLLAKRPA